MIVELKPLARGNIKSVRGHKRQEKRAHTIQYSNGRGQGENHPYKTSQKPAHIQMMRIAGTVALTAVPKQSGLRDSTSFSIMTSTHIAIPEVNIKRPMKILLRQ